MFEEVAPQRTGAFRAVFLIVLMAFLALSLPSWLKPYNTVFDWPYALAIYEFIIFLLGAVLILRFLRRYATVYEYCLMDSTVLIKEKIGVRDSVRVQISVTGDTRLIPFAEATDLIQAKKWNLRNISYGVSDKKTAYFLIIPEEKGEFALVFQPSDKFVEILQQKVLDKRKEM